MSRGHVTGGNHVEETVHATLSASIHATNHVRVESIGQKVLIKKGGRFGRGGWGKAWQRVPGKAWKIRWW
jgi:hypothetical protein